MNNYIQIIRQKTPILIIPGKYKKWEPQKFFTLSGAQFVSSAEMRLYEKLFGVNCQERLVDTFDNFLSKTVLI